MAHTTIRHWLPILTFCPVNNLPDLIYISVEFKVFAELYFIRKEVRKLASLKTMFMEDIADKVLEHFPSASAVEVRLFLNRHVVRVERHVPVY